MPLLSPPTIAGKYTPELVRRGYTEDEIAKIWSGNILRVWREVIEAARRTAG